MGLIWLWWHCVLIGHWDFCWYIDAVGAQFFFSILFLKINGAAKLKQSVSWIWWDSSSAASLCFCFIESLLLFIASYNYMSCVRLFWSQVLSFSDLGSWLDVLICACFNGLLNSFGMVFGELGNSLDWKKMGFLGWIRLCVGIDSCLELLLLFFF